MSAIFAMAFKAAMAAWKESEAKKERRLEENEKEEIDRNKVIKERQKAAETEMQQQDTAIKKMQPKNVKQKTIWQSIVIVIS